MNIKTFILICTFFEIVSSAPTQTEESSELFEGDMKLSKEQVNEIEESANSVKINKRENPSEGNEEAGNAFEGDMKLSPEQMKEIEESINNAGTVSERKVILKVNYRWPNGEVPYILDSSFSDSGKEKVLKAMQHIKERTCVRFVEFNETLGHTNRVRITSAGKGCWAFIGRQYKKANMEQKIQIGPKCSFGAAVHELLHTLGLYHEQSRTDRDDYLIIHWENINDKKKGNFKKYGANHITDLDVPYDYESIMHYRKTAFSKNGQLTIKTKDASMQNKIGQRRKMSPIDVEVINKMYNCPGISESSPTGTEGA